ncbi:MAG: PEP-utilizing enzyme [Dehalococcoidia bacterium]|nr:PEP-utilizing enzyme [Dehalococcoidia bacterium]
MTEQVKIWDAVPGYDFDEEADLKDNPSWFLDIGHSWPPLKPLAAWYWMHNASDGNTYARTILSFPWCKAVEFRYQRGASYVGMVVVKGKEEIKQRQVKYNEAMKPFIEDFDSWWQKARDDLMGMYDRIKNFDFESATGVDLLYHLFNLDMVNRRMWEIHCLGFGAAVDGWVLFEQLCKELLDLNDSQPEFQKLVSGYENKIHEVDRRMWQLGQDSVNKGLADILLETEVSELLLKLEQTEAGRQWVKDLRDFLDEDGWRMQHMHVFDEPTWIEDPAPAIWSIRGYIAKGGGFSLDEVRKRLVKEREELEKAIIQRVPEERKDEFLRLLRLAQKAGAFNEEHTYYCESYCHAVMRRSFLKIGEWLSKGGAIDEPEDIFFLNPDEIRRAIYVPEHHDMRYIVNRRRRDWEDWHKIDRPPVITKLSSMEEAFADMMASRDSGAKIAAGELPTIRPELNADLYGVCGSPGFAEGPARVIMTVEQLGEVKPGDILVAPTTATTWTPVFALIKGAVIDRGGPLAHAAIVGREYGIPIILNVFEGTKKIESGQRIRLDATQGVVYIL